jgi:hypothetical protein
MNINAIQKQWPVGQGGFATGEITFGDNPVTKLSYVYDCGSDTLTPLREAISDFAVDREVIDIAFLSHLDSDHVNGVDMLLGKCAVSHVVLPYLDNFALIDAIGRAVVQDAYTVALAEFLVEPVAWLRARGVGHVWMVGRAPGDEGPAVPRPGGEPRFEAVEFTVTSGNSQRVEAVNFGIIGGHGGDTLPGGEQISLLDSGTMLIASPDRKSIGWWFVPYAPPVHPLQLANLKAALLAIGLDMNKASAQDILVFVRDHRKAFQSCYSAIAREHNDVSLCLFSSPPLTGTDGILCSLRGPHELLSTGRLGWMHTGDAPWGTQYQIRAAKAFYNNFLNAIGVLVVPHHGSGYSFRVEALKMCSPSVSVLPYGIDNRHGHPHGAVKNLLAMASTMRVDVTEDASTYFSTHLFT